MSATNPSSFINLIKLKYQNIDNGLGFLDRLEIDINNNYLLYHKSFEDYCLDRAPCCKRKVIYTLHWILSLIFMVYMSILLKYNDDISTRDLVFPIMMEIEGKRIAIMIFFLMSSIFFLGKSLIFYFELKKMCYFINLLQNWSNWNFQLKLPLAEKLSMHINISFR